MTTDNFQTISYKLPPLADPLGQILIRISDIPNVMTHTMDKNSDTDIFVTETLHY